ncbi:thiamine phosphate synthase, partial [Treponema endosymbiont of Eucomonympha sp.]|uniref:thiamine phosphate synthase n=1 Tax=Treponema endosymbiont of Eucomonympha sp. TaxID=1580831 RepID=UPI001396BE2C
AVFPTDTKADAGEAVGLERLRAIVGAVRIPVVGIGGVNAGNARSVVQTGAAGIALVSGIISQDDVEAAARELKELVGVLDDCRRVEQRVYGAQNQREQHRRTPVPAQLPQRVALEGVYAKHAGHSSGRGGAGQRRYPFPLRGGTGIARVS